MPRGFHNWTGALVIKFLKQNDFKHSHTRGSHFYYVGKVDGKDHQVCIPVHGGSSIHPKTLKSIIVQSGISDKEWKK